MVSEEIAVADGVTVKERAHDPYWIVMRQPPLKGDARQYYRHATGDAAIKEATRLVMAGRGKKFAVMECIAVAEIAGGSVGES